MLEVLSLLEERLLDQMKRDPDLPKSRVHVRVSAEELEELLLYVYKLEGTNTDLAERLARAEWSWLP